jgi:hypothetical protein
MSSPLRKGLLPALALAVFTLAPLASMAQQPFNPMAAQQQAEAKEHFNQAKAAAAEGRHADAIKLFKKADELDPKPETKFEIAKSLAADNKLIEASTLLNDILGATPAPPWSVKNPAQKMLTEVQAKIPWLQIKIVGPDQSLTSTTVDGKEVDAEQEIPWNPGEYVIAADADGYKPVEKRVTIAEGAHELVELELERIGGPRPKKTPPAATATATATAPGPDTIQKPVTSGGGDITSGPFFIPMVVGGGVGVVGVGVGAVFGIMALNETASIEDCRKNVCPDTSRNRRAKEAALLNGNISTIAFIAGGVGLAAGATMLILQLSSAPKPQPATTTGFIRPYVGAGQAGVFGAF